MTINDLLESRDIEYAVILDCTTCSHCDFQCFSSVLENVSHTSDFPPYDIQFSPSLTPFGIPTHNCPKEKPIPRALRLHVLHSPAGFGLRSSCPQQLSFRYVATNLEPACTLSHSSNLSENHFRLFQKVPIQYNNTSTSNKNNERHQADLQPEGCPA
jgi:hypothetical protein